MDNTGSIWGFGSKPQLVEVENDLTGETLQVVQKPLISSGAGTATAREFAELFPPVNMMGKEVGWHYSKVKRAILLNEDHPQYIETWEEHVFDQAYYIDEQGGRWQLIHDDYGLWRALVGSEKGVQLFLVKVVLDNKVIREVMSLVVPALTELEAELLGEDIARKRGADKDPWTILSSSVEKIGPTVEHQGVRYNITLLEEDL